MNAHAAWVVVPPPEPSRAGTAEVPAMRALTRRHLDLLVEEGIYTVDELAALEDPSAECSWRPELDRLAGPLPTVAVSAGRVVAGVYLFQNQQGGYWFLDVLIRDPASEFRGAGFAVVEAAIAWWKQYASGRSQLKVHSMQRERDAVAWWTRYMRRQPDYDDAFIRSRSHFFPVVGWVADPGWPA